MNRSSTDPRWRGLFLAGAVGAALTAACIPLQVLLFIAWPPPASRDVADWFGLFNGNPVRGLLSMDLVMMVEQVLLVPMVIALWVVLRRTSESLMTLAVPLWLAGGFLFIGSNTAFEMLSLAHGYAAATTEAARAGYLAAGQGMLASYLDMGTGFVLGYVTSSVGGLLAGVAMLRTAGWHAAGRVLIAGTVLGLCIFLPVVGIGLSLLSVLVLVVWYALVAVRLGRLAAAGRGRAAEPAEPAQPASRLLCSPSGPDRRLRQRPYPSRRHPVDPQTIRAALPASCSCTASATAARSPRSPGSPPGPAGRRATGTLRGRGSCPRSPRTLRPPSPAPSGRSRSSGLLRRRSRWPASRCLWMP